MSQILAGPNLKRKTAESLWTNAVKALLAEIWFERNQRVFHDKSSTWLERYDSAVLNASSWCSLTKYFQDYSSQEIVLNWPAFIAPPPWSSRVSCLPNQPFAPISFCSIKDYYFVLYSACCLAYVYVLDSLFGLVLWPFKLLFGLVLWPLFGSCIAFRNMVFRFCFFVSTFWMWWGR